MPHLVLVITHLSTAILSCYCLVREIIMITHQICLNCRDLQSAQWSFCGLIQKGMPHLIRVLSNMNFWMTVIMPYLVQVILHYQPCLDDHSCSCLNDCALSCLSDCASSCLSDQSSSMAYLFILIFPSCLNYLCAYSSDLPMLSWFEILSMIILWSYPKKNMPHHVRAILLHFISGIMLDLV